MEGMTMVPNYLHLSFTAGDTTLPKISSYASLIIPTAGQDIFAVFVGSCSKMYCSELALPLIYIPVKIIWIRLYIYIYLHDIIFSYSLTATRTLTFGYINRPQILPLLEASLMLRLVSMSSKG